MAEGFGYGIDLTNLSKQLTQADARLKALASSAEKTMGQINTAFSKGVSGGVSAFIREISKANSAIVQLSQAGANFEFNPLGGGSKFYASVMNDVNKIMSQTRRQLEDLNKHKLKDIIDPNTSLDSIKQLEARLAVLQESLSTGKVGKRAIGSRQRAMYADEIAAIEERLKVLRMSTAEFNKLKADEVATLLKNAQTESEINAKRLRDERKMLEEQRRNAVERAKSGDTTAHALKYSDMVLSDKGLRSINNMQRAIEMARDAQNKLNLNTKDGEQAYYRLEGRIRRIQGEIDKATGKTNGFKKAHGGLLNIADQLQRKFALVFSVSQITGYIKKLIEVRGEFELQQKALQAIVQNVDEANKLWEKTVALAVKSPFRVKELVTYTKQLAAYRVETSKLYDTTKMLADVSAGLGVDMSRLILAYGQVKAANYLRGTELRQFSEAGINILGELATYFSELEGRVVSVGDVFERVSKRMVSFADVEEIFKRVTSEGGVFYNMQEIQAETLKGQIGNLRDSIDIMLNDIGKSNESTLKGLISGARKLVDNWEEAGAALKIIVPAFVALKLTSKASALGLKEAGDSALWFHKGLNTTVFAASKARLSLKGLTTQQKIFTTAQYLGVKATVAFQTALKGVGAAFRSIAPYLAIAALVEFGRRVTESSRAAKRLRKDLDGIFAEDTSKLDKSIDRYGDLVTRLREANEGSKERRDIISKLNNEYGEYLDFVVTEQTSVDKLADSYDVLVKRMKEKAAMNTYEKAAQEISDSYGQALKDAKEEFYELFEGASIKMRGNNLGAAFKSIVPSKDEIDDIYNLLQQKINALSSDQLDSLAKQQKLVQSVVAGYYGEEYYLSRDYAKSIELINILVDKKKAEEELQKEINAQYKATLKSRKANLEYAKLEQEYELAQNEIRATKGLSDFEVKKRLAKLQEEFELNKIELQFKFGAISKREMQERKNALLNWASETTRDINDAIRRNLSNFMTEEQWSAFLITPDKQAQGMSGIIKDITDGYESMTKEIQTQVSLQSAGRKYDKEGLALAQKKAKAYEAVADIMGIELKKQEMLSEEIRTQINELMPVKHKISLEDAYKGIKALQTETSNEYKTQLELIETLIAQKNAGLLIDGDSLEMAKEDLEILRQKMELLGMKTNKPMEETTRLSINYELPSKFKISEADALKGVVDINKEAASAFEAAQNELSILLKMEDKEIEGLEERILLLQSEMPYLQKKVELTGTYLKDRLTEQQLSEINSQLETQYQLNQINLYKDRSVVISEIKSKEDEIAEALRQAYRMSDNQLSLKVDYINKLEEEYLIQRKIRSLLDPDTEKKINQEKVNSINAKLEEKNRIGILDSVKSEATLLSETNQEKEKAIAYQAQLLAMKAAGTTVTKEELELAAKEVEQLTLKWKLLGGTEKDKSRTESLMDERIKVVDDMNKAYKDLNKTLSKAESLQGAFAKYKDAFYKAYKGTSLLPKNFATMTGEQFIKEFNFTTEKGMVEFFDKLIKYAKKTSEKVDVELAKGDYIMETRVVLQKDADEKLYDEIQDMFDRYNLYVEIKELGINRGLAKSLFDIDAISLDELKNKVTDAFMGVDSYGEKIKNVGQLMKDTFNGTVDLLNRKLIPAQNLAKKGWDGVGDGLATVFSSSYSVTDASGKNIDILVTPILPDGTVLSQKELENYIGNTLEGVSDILAADNKGIVIHAEVDMDANMGEYLHSLQQVFYASEMLSEDQKDKMKDFLNKIADMEYKAQVERLKSYLKYSKMAIGERAKIKVEELNKLKEIEEAFNGAEKKAKTEEDKSRVREERAKAEKVVRQEAVSQEQKLDWEEFKTSDTFVNLFQDLDNASTTLIQHAISKIQEFREQWKDMPVTEAKEMITKLNELEVKLLDTGKPFEEYKKSMKTLEQAMLRRDIKPNKLTSQQELRDNIATENIGFEEEIKNGNQIISILNTINSITSETKEADLAKVGITKDYVESLGLGAEVLTNSIKDNNDIIDGEREKVGLAKDNLNANNKLLKIQGSIPSKLNAQASAIGKAKDMANDLYDAFKGLAEALGSDSDGPAAIFADMGMNMLNTVLNTIMLQIQLNAAAVSATGLGLALNSAMGVIGWIVMGVQLLIQAITAIVQAQDKAIDEQVEAQKKQIEELEKRYDKLSDKISEIYDLNELERVSRELDDIYKKEIEATKAAIALRKSDSKISDDERAEIEELEEQLVELEETHAQTLKDIVSQATDGILDSVYDAAKDFTDAWYDAFKETGDGLSGLEDNFQEMFLSLVKNQAAMKLVAPFIEKWKNELNKYVNEKDTVLTQEEASQFAEVAQSDLPIISQNLEKFFSAIQSGLETTGSLSELQKGIQGVTEETAQVLESLLNSMRFYVADSNSELKNQTKYMRDIYNMLSSLTTSSNEGLGFKVVMV